MKAVLDPGGRILLPKRLRDRLRLQPGDVLEIETSGEEITLSPVREQPQLRKKHGIWVHRTGQRLSADAVEKTIRRIRRERDARNLGT
jgi:AbrB family looped-hinge helix DNA binding protein